MISSQLELKLKLNIPKTHAYMSLNSARKCINNIVELKRFFVKIFQRKGKSFSCSVFILFSSHASNCFHLITHNDRKAHVNIIYYIHQVRFCEM
jgi:hypothetical protein